MERYELERLADGRMRVTVRHRGKHRHTLWAPHHYRGSFAPYYYEAPRHGYRSYAYSAWSRPHTGAFYSPRQTYYWRTRPWW